MYAIQDIQNALVKALKENVSLSSLCRKIDSYHGEIDGFIEQSQSALLPIPAVYVLYTGSDFMESANLSFDEEQTYSLLVIAKDLRGNQVLKDAVYPLLNIIKPIVIGNDLGLNIEPLKPVRLRAELISQMFSIYSFDVKTSFSMD